MDFVRRIVCVLNMTGHPRRNGYIVIVCFSFSLNAFFFFRGEGVGVASTMEKE